MRSKFTLASLGLTLLAPVATLQAEIGQTLLYDFETAWQIEDWEVRDASIQSVYQAKRFATSGQYSAGFRMAASERPPHFRLPVWDNHWAHHSYGFNSPIKSLGAWCPIIRRYNPDLADKAPEEGRESGGTPASGRLAHTPTFSWTIRRSMTA